MIKQPTVVIVLGTARTGTSMTAGILNRLGVDMGAEEKLKDDENARGAMEHPGFIHLTQRARTDGIDDAWRHDIKELMRERCAKQYWGFKSALTHYCIQEVHEAVKTLGLRPVYVVTHRDKQDTIASYIVHQKRRYGNAMSEQDAEKAIDESNTALGAAVEYLKGLNLEGLEVDFVTLKSNPYQVSQELNDIIFQDADSFREHMLKIAAGFVDEGWSTIGG